MGADMTEPITTNRDVEVAPELAPLDLPDKPDGPAAAVMLAAGLGVFTMGLFTTLGVISEAIHDFLAAFEVGRGVGPLAGKSVLATLVFFVSWVVLHYMWKDKDVDIKRIFWIGLALGVVGAVLMFPPVFEALE